jgi:KDO2-lipid IV(A) lauroyltransferase
VTHGRIVHLGSHALDALPLVHHLKRGGVVAVQLDRGAPSGRELTVELFGRPFRVPEGPFRIAAALGAPILPLFARRVGYARYALRVSPPIRLSPEARREDLENAARVAVSAMERFVREYPTQWFHFGN